MSTVFLGCDIRTARPVAVKILAPRLAAQPAFITRFYREGRMSRLLSHSNLVGGIDHGYDRTAQQYYLILEYIDGPTALAVLHRYGPPPLGLVVAVGIETCRALEHLHRAGYVHRDVKPDNILIGPDGTVKLGDLGLAKRLADDSDLTALHPGIGTPHYMPYEQAVSSDLVDARSDLFALGATLYHLVTGRVPYPGENRTEIVRCQELGPPASGRRFRPTLPRDLDACLLRSLAFHPRSRYQSAKEFGAALVSTGLATGSFPPRAPTVAVPRQSPGARTHAGYVPAMSCPCPPPCATR